MHYKILTAELASGYISYKFDYFARYPSYFLSSHFTKSAFRLDACQSSVDVVVDLLMLLEAIR